MRSLHYLTVQDILWINLQVTKKVHHFSFAKLEEATFYQYAYGESKSLVPQAARFLTGFNRLHPFEAGNTATALVACFAFLKINGLAIKLSDEQSPIWLGQVNGKQTPVADLIAEITVEDSEHHEKPDVRATVKSILAQFPCTIESLVRESVPL